MKVVKIGEDCQLFDGDSPVIKLEGGKFYIMSDILKERFSTLRPDVFNFEIPFSEVYNKYKGQPLNGKKIFMLRHGGGGDILFMMTGANVLKEMYPDMKLGVAIGSQYVPLLQGSIVDTIHSLPIPLDVWNEYHYHLMFEGLIEDNKEAQEFNAYDLFMKEMGLDISTVLSEKKIPKLFITEEEKDKMFNENISLAYTNKKIGIQVASSSSIRNYPYYHYIKVASALIEKGYQVYFFGGGPQMGTIENLMTEIRRDSEVTTQIVNMANHNLRASLIVASFMDCFIAPDSMFIHIAGALDIPVIGIYGPFHSDLRMRYFKNAVGIDVDCGCSPCFQHGHFPCHKGDPSPCFSLISPELIINVFEKKIEGELWSKTTLKLAK